MEDFKRLLTSQKILKLKIDLVKDFPVTVSSDASGSVKKSEKVFLKDVVFSEDLPSLIDQIDAFISKNTDSLYTHLRILTGNDYEWFLISCELRKNKFARLPYLSGTIFNMSHYLENVGEDPVVKEYRLKNIEKIVSVNSGNTALTDILEREYLEQIQIPFKYASDIYSAIFNEKNELICTPIPKQKSFDLSAYKYNEKYEIRINHSVAGYWIIASDNEDMINQCLPLLEVLGASVSRIANAYVMLYNEMTNSTQANKMLGENIEQQILVNSVYNIILEQKQSDVALNSVIKLVGEYIGIERISIFFDDKEQKRLDLKYEWAEKERFYQKEKSYSYDEIPKTIEKLSYTDLYYPRESGSEFSVGHYAAVNLNGDGIRFAVIIYEAIEKEASLTSNESKMLRSISQIIATLLLQYQMDIKLENTNEKLRRLAFNDAILDIPNRAQLDKDLSEILEKQSSGAAITLKLTNMRIFNELFGHAYTDKLLKSVANFLKEIPAENLKVYRFSGNMLMIILTGCNGLHAKKFAENVQQRFGSPWEQEGNSHFLESGIGISLFPENGGSCEEVYRAATLAMYRAVEYGTNSYTIYSKEFEKPASADYYYSQKLRRSMSEGMQGFKLLYQPIIDEASGEVLMCEAFINWEDGEDRLSPSKLIRLAENMGFDIMLDSWVIESACRFCKKVQRELYSDFTVSVNITARELRSSSVVPMVQNALAKTGLNGKHLYIEIPEHVISGQNRTVIPTVNRLKKCGVNIAIDSFGNDFTASNLLKYSYIDLIKTDYSLFKNVYDRFDEILVDSVINLAKITQHGICVKRVETLEQLETVRKYNVNFVQGYYYSKPLTESELMDFIEEYRDSEELVREVL